MLTLRCKTYDGTFDWYIGEAKIHLPAAIQRLQANGPELDLIHKSFLNIPRTTETGDSSKIVITWTGEMARFIYDNFPWNAKL